MVGRKGRYAGTYPRGAPSRAAKPLRGPAGAGGPQYPVPHPPGPRKGKSTVSKTLWIKVFRRFASLRVWYVILAADQVELDLAR
ncbi:hypothetical protein D3C86_1090020 [compost metagenome]